VTETQAPAPRRRWVALALLASLAVNLFLVGLVGGQFFADPEPEQTRPQSRGYSLNPRIAMQALPEARHEEIRAFWEQSRGGMRRDWRAIGELRREIDAAVRATPFDIEALRAAQQREVAARGEMRDGFNDRIAAFMATLSDAERTAVADVALARMEEQSEYWRERRRKRQAERAERAAATAE